MNNSYYFKQEKSAHKNPLTNTTFNNRNIKKSNYEKDPDKIHIHIAGSGIMHINNM